MDGWDGYAASRRRITQGWVDAKVRNAVVLTGNVHRNWATDVKVDFKDPGLTRGGSELVCTSITSTGNGTGSTTDATMAWNPHLKFTNDNRGYVNTKITKDALTADFRTLDYVTTPGSPVSTKASFAIRDGFLGCSSGVGLPSGTAHDSGGSAFRSRFPDPLPPASLSLRLSEIWIKTDLINTA
jgi:alkaline phosphatase D